MDQSYSAMPLDVTNDPRMEESIISSYCNTSPSRRDARNTNGSQSSPQREPVDHRRYKRLEEDAEQRREHKKTSNRHRKRGEDEKAKRKHRHHPKHEDR